MKSTKIDMEIHIVFFKNEKGKLPFNFFKDGSVLLNICCIESF